VTIRGRVVTVLAAVLVAGLLPLAASAHAYLVKTIPSASTVVDHSPPNVQLTYDEAVEPRFALISVTDADGHQVTDGSVTRSPANPDTLVVPLKHLEKGWYLVIWRVISVDGHPVSGAFTFAVGPGQGVEPEFTIPKISATATTTPLLVMRWLVFLSVMSAIGLFVLRTIVARPVVRRLEGTSLRAVTIAFAAACAIALVAVPIYIEFATANFTLDSVFAVGKLVPLFDTTAFGHGYLILWLCFALFCGAAAVALWVDRPQRDHRSIAELFALGGALLAAAAVLLIPGAAGHAAQTAPRGFALLLDWVHLVAGSLWIGGLIGLLVLWRSLPLARRVAGLTIAVPRFSNMAFVAVFLLLASGIGASVLHLPLLAALWETSYGKAILVKAGLLLAAMLLAAVNLVRTKPRLVAARTRPELGAPTATLLRRLVTGEALLVTAAIFAAAVLSSLPPPPPALASESSALAKVGPGKVAATVHQNGYTLQLLVSPNRAATENQFAVRITKNGQPVTGADVTLTFAMLDMQMGNQEFQLKETQPGVYSIAAPALVMVGHWGLGFQVTPKGGSPFTALVVDHAGG
jgi:copper transport protein